MAAGVRSTWLRHWASVTVVAAVVATVFDAILLQVRRSYFTGGFLSVDHVATLGQAAAFLLGSLAADAAALAGPAALTLWFAARLRLGKRSGQCLAVLTSLAPIAVADFVAYRLESFLGDAFDLDLMFQLAGQSPAEIFAVSAAQLARAAWFALGVALLVAAVVVGIRRARKDTSTGRADALGSDASLGRTVGLWVALVMLSAAVCASLRYGNDVLDNGLKRKPSGRVLGLLVEVVSDVDRDGFGILGRFPDPAPFDERVYPFAVDVPGNGIDENGVAGDLPAGVPPYVEALAGTKLWSDRRSVVMIGLESFRADALGAAVEGVPVTPFLDKLAQTGVSVPRAYSHNGYTVQSRRHMFSGSVADLAADTLIDDFKANGYETAYFSGQDESFGGSAGDVGFDRADVAYDASREPHRRYTTFTTPGSLAVPHTVVVEHVASFLKARRADRPLFLYVNFHDTHFPYHHRFIQAILPTPVLAESEIVPARAQDLRRMYLNTVANVDRAIGRVIDTARATLGDTAGVVVLADHGESLFDEGFLGHGYALNEAQTQIPLVVSNLPMVIRQPFAQADLRGQLRLALSKNFDRVPTGRVRSRAHGVPVPRHGRWARTDRLSGIQQADPLRLPHSAAAVGEQRMEAGRPA